MEGGVSSGFAAALARDRGNGASMLAGWSVGSSLWDSAVKWQIPGIYSNRETYLEAPREDIVALPCHWTTSEQSEKFLRYID